MDVAKEVKELGEFIEQRGHEMLKALEMQNKTTEAA
jgi:hypothetical protein